MGRRNDPFLSTLPWSRSGWRAIPLPPEVKKTDFFDLRLAAWRKTVGNLCLERIVDRYEWRFPSRRRTKYRIYKVDGTTELARFEAHWTDFDQKGRLVASVGGKILAGDINRHHGLRWCLLAEFQDDKPTALVAPEWAQRW